MINYKDIKEVHLEVSTLCNASCPQCPRNFNGYPHNDGYPETYMTLDQAKTIFKPAFLQQLREIVINGNFGDIVMNPDGPDIVEYFREQNDKLRIVVSTNGGARPADFWQRLAKAGAKVLFCIDGIEETHSLYRQNTLWRTVIKNSQFFIVAGGHAVWKTIRFDHNTHQIEEMSQLSKDLGFKNFSVIEHGRDTGPVFNQQKELTHVLGDYTGSTDWKTLFIDQRSENRTVENTASRLDPVTQDIELTCDTLENQRIYISATGDVSPCCYTGFYPATFGKGSYMQALNSRLTPLINSNNALENEIETCINWFKAVEDSWKQSTYKEGRLLVCDEICGKCKSK